MDEQVTPAGIVDKIVDEAKGMSRPAYRGQARADSWELRSGAVDRLVEAYGDHMLEDENGLRKLVSQYHRDLILRMEVIDGERMEYWQRLSILQHHGGATGLLDFTESPLRPSGSRAKTGLTRTGRCSSWTSATIRSR